MGQSLKPCCLSPKIDSQTESVEVVTDSAFSFNDSLGIANSELLEKAIGSPDVHLRRDKDEIYIQRETYSPRHEQCISSRPIGGNSLSEDGSGTGNTDRREQSNAGTVQPNTEGGSSVANGSHTRMTEADATISPSLQELHDLWRAYIDDTARHPQIDKLTHKMTDKNTVNWRAEGSEAHLRVMRSMNNQVDLARFYDAKEGDVKKAFSIAKTAALWLAAVQPSSISKSLIARPLNQNVWRWAGWSKCGYPIVSVEAKIWKPSQYCLDDYIRYTMYTINAAIQHRQGPGIDRGVLIFELEFTFEQMKPIATRCLLSLSTILQEVYAERFAALFFCNGNALFRAAWHGLKHLVERRNAPLIHFVPVRRNREVLGRFIDCSILEQRFGGDHPSYEYPPISCDASVDVPAQPPPAYNADAPDPFRDPVL